MLWHRVHYQGPRLLSESVVTLGNFDGMHLGHQELVAQTVMQAKILSLPSVAVIFEPLPVEYFSPGASNCRIQSTRDKYHHMRALGIDVLVCLRFDAALAQCSPQEFLHDFLHQRLGMQLAVVGKDCGFGHKRAGNVEFLKQHAAEYAFGLQVVDWVMCDGERVSSTRVRQACLDQNMALVERLLGRAMSLSGRVMRGDQRGRTIGFPTANIALSSHLRLLQGVYAVRVKGWRAPLFGVANVGTRPTVDGTRFQLEVHCFNFDDDLYGRRLDIEFLSYIRGEKRFDGLDALKAQIGRDKETAEKICCGF